VDRARLVQETLPLVGKVAGAIGARLPHSVEMSDLTQAGVLGLLDAAEKFDQAKGVRFRTYAELRIRGAILDSLRSLDWVPRSLRRERRELQRAESRLEAKLGRRPTDEELASEMELSIADLEGARERVRRVEVASFEAEDFDRVAARTIDPLSPDPHEHLERREIESLLARAIEKLPARERLVLTLYYHEELTMKEVGGILGVNESRVSQIHSKAVSKLRLRLRRDLRPRASLAKSA
jgi:RNA polymerase sigma factor for flagellar operon FliA